MKFKSRDSNAEEIQLNMTSMIDIVFQLLVFFIMTFKITAQEADFNIKMPAPSKTPESIIDVESKVIEVSLLANAERVISGIKVDNEVSTQSFTATYDSEGQPKTNHYKQLTKYIEESITTESDPSSQDETEVEFIIDESLRYGYTVQAIEAVYGRIDENGNRKKLIEKIKFRPR